MARLESLLPEFGDSLRQILNGNENTLSKMDDLSLVIQGLLIQFNEQSKRLAAISCRLDAVETKLDSIRELVKRNFVVQPQEAPSRPLNSVQSADVPASAESVAASSDTDVIQSYPFKSQEYYFSTPSSKGFEMGNNLDSPARALYQIRTISDSSAEFFPLVEKMLRFRVSPESLLLSVCDVQGDIMTCSSLNVDSPGTLIKEDNTWVVDKKCQISTV